jgi:hypothetical protein
MILKNPHEFFAKYVKGDLSEEKAFFTFGNYIHTLILEPHLAEAEFVSYSGAVRRGKLYDAFKEEHKDKLIITKAEAELAQQIMVKFQAHNIAPKLFSGGTPEDTFATEINGLPVKARLDYLKGDMILDVKTTGGAIDMQSLQQTIVKFDYDLSAALYLDVVNSCSENKVDKFIFFFISKETCDSVLVQASTDMIENGRRKYLKAIAKYQKLKAEGFFDPNKITPDIEIIELPEYAKIF